MAAITTSVKLVKKQVPGMGLCDVPDIDADSVTVLGPDPDNPGSVLVALSSDTDDGRVRAAVLAGGAGLPADQAGPVAIQFLRAVWTQVEAVSKAAKVPCPAWADVAKGVLDARQKRPGR